MKRFLSCAVFLVVLVSISVCVQAAVICVRTTGSDANTGLSWDIAKKTVQAAINAAAAGDEVRVAAGVYSQCITIQKNVKLYGGFPAEGGEWENRDIKKNETILDGNKQGTVITINYGVTTGTRIDGFTIRNGYTTSGNGGGIRCTSGSPVIANNRIIGNSASSSCDGGGISCNSCSPTILNNIISGNYSGGGGGGIHCSQTSAKIANNLISQNSGTIVGSGGIVCLSASGTTITNNTIAANGWRGIYVYASTVTISNNIVAFNGIEIEAYGTSPLLKRNCVYNPQGLLYTKVTAGTDDINTDPKFMDPVYGNLHISADSPCRDAGNDALADVTWLDIDGQGRIGGSRIDMGCDESYGETGSISGPNVIIRVSPTGSDANDGSSWTLAKKTVQAAINAAAEKGGEVWVAAGKYTENIVLHSFVYMYGGFAGGETERDQRDWKNNITSLDGNQSKYNAVVGANAGYRQSRIDGFTVRNSIVAGIQCNGSPIITNNIVTANNGGGLSSENASPLISHNTIVDNRAQTGAAISCTGGKPEILENTISGNASKRDAGAVYLSATTATLLKNTFSRNQTVGFGAGIYCNRGAAVIAGNNICGNTSSSYDPNGGYFTSRGAGIFCYDVSAKIVNNTITANSCIEGAVYSNLGSIVFANNIVAFNSSGIGTDAGFTTQLSVSNNCIYNPDGQNYINLSAGTGDISVDPKLADIRSGDAHIAPDSPCRNAGWDQAPEIGNTDIDGQARVGDSHIDIGADESYGETVTPKALAVIRVSPAGNDLNDGSSWEKAKRTLNAAISAAFSGGGEVWAAKGVYRERVELKTFVDVYGGFAGTETERAQRNYKGNATIIDNSMTGGGVMASATGHRICTLDGFIIRGSRSAQFGGGIICYSSPIIANNTILDGYAAYGGGIACYSSSPAIINNVIKANQATKLGAGIYSNGGSPLIVNNCISGNSANVIEPGGMSGGGIYYDGSPVIVGNTIIANSASEAGGIYGINPPNSKALIANNVVAFNSSGIYKLVSYGLTGVPVLRNNCVYNPDGYDYKNLDAGQGDLSVDPKFVDMTFADPHIAAGSPCVDAGWTEWPIASAVDVDGQPRVYGGALDIGADEFSGAAPTIPEPSVVRVKTDGSDVNDGSSWELAKATIQSAIDDVVRNGGGEVWITKGNYPKSILLKSFVHLYGGFAGTEIERDSRNAITNVTEIGLNLVSGSRCITAVCGQRLGLIDGLTVRGGSAIFGGGIFACYNAPIIRNYSILSNAATRDGAGIFCIGAGIIENNLISQNYSLPQQDGMGDGLFCYGRVRVTGNVIENNYGAQYGSGMYCQGEPTKAPALVERNIIRKNTARSEAGGIFASDNVAVCGNIIAENTSRNGGAGIKLVSSAYNDNFVVNNTIVGNVSTLGGLAVYWDGDPGSANIINNIIAYNTKGVGGSICTGCRQPNVSYNCVFRNGSVDYTSNFTLGPGNVLTDPMFADLDGGNYHLLAGSPCLHVGMSNASYLAAFDMDGEGRCWRTVDIGADEYWPLSVQIDILPGVNPNIINPKSSGKLAVAILSGNGFDARTVDPASVELAGAKVAAVGKGNLQAQFVDVDLDGDMDLLVYFQTQSLNLQGATSLTLNGRIKNGGDWIEGSDSVSVMLK